MLGPMSRSSVNILVVNMASLKGMKAQVPQAFFVRTEASHQLYSRFLGAPQMLTKVWPKKWIARRNKNHLERPPFNKISLSYLICSTNTLCRKKGHIHGI